MKLRLSYFHLTFTYIPIQKQRISWLIHSYFVENLSFVIPLLVA
jgi:hypothetical protein